MRQLRANFSEPQHDWTPAGRVSAAARTELREQETVLVRLSLLMPGDSPRSEGSDEAHIARLAEIDEQLPPILVDHGNMRVIDGNHRLEAARRKGQATIQVKFFVGTEEEAFLHAVKANVTHGLPLSLADRRAAATRILRSHPHMSDQLIAEAAGLGSTTVAALRRSSGSKTPQPVARIGKDGKVRPLNALEGRERAAAAILEHPEGSLRDVARTSGVSLATASDVRRRLERGEQPTPSRPTGRSGRRAAERAAQSDLAAALRKLLRDPSLRYCQTGRQLLLLLQHNANAARKWADVIISVPPHCRPLVRQLARHYAQMWTELEQELNEQARQSSADPSRS